MNDVPEAFGDLAQTWRRAPGGEVVRVPSLSHLGDGVWAALVRWPSGETTREPADTVATWPTVAAPRPRTYARLTWQDGARRRTLRVEVLAEDARFLLCREVDADGTECAAYYRHDGVLIEPKHLIDKTLVVRRVPLVEDRHYGVLVTAKTA